jgi:hypothetical protein
VRVVIVGIYLAVLVGVVVAVNADGENGDAAFLVWSVASLALGAAVRHPLVAILPLLAIPLAVPFGGSEEWVGSDRPLVVLGMVFQAPVQVLLVVAGLVGRALFERGRRRRGSGTNQ